MCGVVHKKGNVSRLYMKRKQGVRRLISTDCVNVKKSNLGNYMINFEERLLNVAKDILQVKNDEESRKEYQERVMLERFKSLQKKPMHGKWFRENKGAFSKAFAWVASGFFAKKTGGIRIRCARASDPNKLVKITIKWGRGWQQV